MHLSDDSAPLLTDWTNVVNWFEYFQHRTEPWSSSLKTNIPPYDPTKVTDANHDTQRRVLARIITQLLREVQAVPGISWSSNNPPQFEFNSSELMTPLERAVLVEFIPDITRSTVQLGSLQNPISFTGTFETSCINDYVPLTPVKPSPLLVLNANPSLTAVAIALHLASAIGSTRDRICPVCDRAFTATRRTKLYCGMPCRANHKVCTRREARRNKRSGSKEPS